MNSPLREMDRHPALPRVPRPGPKAAPPRPRVRTLPTAAIVPTSGPQFHPQPPPRLGAACRPDPAPLACRETARTEGSTSPAAWLLFACLGLSLFVLFLA